MSTSHYTTLLTVGDAARSNVMFLDAEHLFNFPFFSLNPALGPSIRCVLIQDLEANPSLLCA